MFKVIFFLILGIFQITQVQAMNTTGIDNTCSKNLPPEKCSEIKNQESAEIQNSEQSQGGLYVLKDNKCEPEQDKNLKANGQTVFENQANCTAKLKEEFSNEKFATMTLPQQKDYCKKLDMRHTKNKCKGKVIGNLVSDISFDGGSILSGAGSLAEDFGLKDNAQKQVLLKQNPLQYVQEHCDDPKLDKNCMAVLSRPENKALFVDKICSEQEVKDEKCKKMIFEVKGEEGYVQEMCEGPKSRLDKRCSPDNLIRLKQTEMFQEIYCSNDNTRLNDKRCKEFEEVEEEEADEPEDNEEDVDEDDDEEDDDDEF